MTRTSHSTGRIISALVISVAIGGLAPALVSPAGAASLSSSVEAGKGKVKVEGKLGKDHVKVNEKVDLKGNLQVLDAARSEQTVETVIVQQLQAGAWVNIADTTCRPNGGFSFSLSFNLSATVSLRLYHPETALYAAAYSASTLTLRVG
ncbi:hypothetical protein AMES_2355 [Amycolatopsis mediterranei S699]|uniref:Uncharacterized protein n=2 Tax=Amycolatopsis mediterranei TaxID=33910 RepID=A0A0H3D3R4_AMYMU|nr:hypothetical protein [Amycolatopsis mediterranei]ADJ44178.1 hypothetical protein AMED_2382 [Amycolatopsis mediterranei U32]AEK40913.1 hypothetical protein RAM_12115 [Amycolatopsis mediterranei S699]AFO75891.1 hypothetical protein AMES_2355 [Amycolatopsis mediterranei S699]AGT83020.1 hypothetical protein B737_2356 [Amycolatopsis mediterranei RB]KDO06905.1 hypothetical protein DV26_32410 [Amycolatopsis mediterranei]